VNVDLQSTTDAGSFVFCDASFQKQQIETNAAILEAVRSGSALLYSAGGDVDIRARVIVGEEVPKSFLSRVAVVESQRLLRLPTGRLIVCGVEEHPKLAADATPCELPIGNYLVDAYLLEWGEEADAKAKAASDEILKRKTTVRFRRLQNALGCLALVFVFGALPGLWVSFRYFGPVAGVVTSLALAMIWLAAWIFPKIFQEQESATLDAFNEAERVRSEFPDVVLHLGRLPDDADLSPWPGGHLRSAP
jgi:hypothetical protein